MSSDNARDPRALLEGFRRFCEVCCPDDATRASAAADFLREVSTKRSTFEREYLIGQGMPPYGYRLAEAPGHGRGAPLRAHARGTRRTGRIAA